MSTDYTNNLDPGMGINHEECGYNARFKYSVQLHSYGVNPAMIDWMAEHCKGKYGWHFNPHDGNDPYSASEDWYEHQDAFCSFSHKKDAIIFSLTWSGTE